MSKPVLYLGVSSPFSRFVDYVVKILKIEDKLERKYLDMHAAGGGEHKTEEMVRINPRQQLPMLHDGDLKITESRAIAIYLCGKYDCEGKLYPRDVIGEAKVNEVLFFDVAELAQLVVVHFRKLLGTPLPHDVPAKINTAFGYFTHLLADRKFIVGDSLSIADIALATNFSLFDVLNLKLSEVCPAAEKYYAGLLETIPGFKQETEETNAKLVKFIESRKAEAAAASQ